MNLLNKIGSIWHQIQVKLSFLLYEFGTARKAAPFVVNYYYHRSEIILKDHVSGLHPILLSIWLRMRTKRKPLDFSI